jgi:hypothetical protein
MNYSRRSTKQLISLISNTEGYRVSYGQVLKYYPEDGCYFFLCSTLNRRVLIEIMESL